MEQTNRLVEDPDTAIGAQAYQNETRRLTRLIWDLEGPIESSKRCINELKSRPHVLSDEEGENLRSEEQVLQKLEADLQQLKEQRDDLQCTPAGLRAQEISKMQQEIERSIKPFSPEELAGKAKAFRQKAEEERSKKRHISNLAWGGGVAIMMLVPAVAAVLWRT